VIAVALVIATAIGLVSGSHEGVKAVWAAAAFPLDYIFRTYFEDHGR